MKKSFILFSIFLLTAVVAYPQRGGGGGKGGNGGGRGIQDSPRQQGQYQRGTQTGNGETERKQIRINSQQRKQLGECSNIADGIRKQAQNMARSSGNQFNAGSARRQLNQIQEQTKTMEQEHQRLMQGLDPEQQQGFQEQIRNMNRLQTQVNTQLRQMNEELAPANPDAEKVREQARVMERTMNELKKQYNTLASESD